MEKSKNAHKFIQTVAVDLSQTKPENASDQGQKHIEKIAKLNAHSYKKSAKAKIKKKREPIEEDETADYNTKPVQGQQQSIQEQ